MNQILILATLNSYKQLSEITSILTISLDLKRVDLIDVLRWLKKDLSSLQDRVRTQQLLEKVGTDVLFGR